MRKPRKKIGLRKLPRESQLFVLQLFGLGLVSKRTAIAMLGIVDDPDAEMAQIQAEFFPQYVAVSQSKFAPEALDEP